MYIDYEFSNGGPFWAAICSGKRKTTPEHVSEVLKNDTYLRKLTKTFIKSNSENDKDNNDEK